MFFIGLAVIPFVTAWAQTEDLHEEELTLEILMELLPEERAEDPDLSDIMEWLNELKRNPLDINQLSAEDLRGFRFLSPLLIGHILEYKERTGGFLSVNELQSIEGLDLRTARFLSQFFIVRNPSLLESISYKELAKRGKHEWIFRYGRILESQQGYLTKDTSRSRYLGSPDRLLLRYRYDLMPDLRVAVNMEKDAGEQFFSGVQRYGFDFYSGSLHIRNQRYYSDLVIGDYVLQFGQGLGMWAGYATGKGAILHGIARQGMGIRPHTTANEIDFHRGLAAAVKFRSWRLIPFISYRDRDGNVQEQNNGEEMVASLGQSGMHRTPTEAANRYQVSQFSYGINIERDLRLWRVGATVYTSHLSAELQPADVLRNHYAFRGSELIHTSLYYLLNFRNVYFFGESARSSNGGMAFLNGALLSLHHHISLGVLHRYYQRHHHSFFAQAFGEGSSVANEKGLYVGIQYQPNRKFTALTYVDWVYFPGSKFRVDGPSRGLDLLSQLTYSRSRRTQLSFRFRTRHKQLNIDIGRPEYVLEQTVNHQFRISYDSKLGQQWRIRNRVEHVIYSVGKSPAESGWMFYQDLFYQPMGAKLTGNLRLAYFHTDSYDTRIYAYENDVLFASSFPAFHNKGIRSYLNLRWKINRSLDIWSRYALSGYLNPENIGSGLDQIPSGNTRSEFKLQLRFRIL